MIRKIVFTTILFLGVYTLQAQNFSGKGDQKLQAGFSFYGKGTGIKATYDYGLSDMFSVGGGAVFYNTGDYKSKFSIFGRGDFHFAQELEAPDELDLYLGAEIGLIGDGDFGFNGHLGGRYNLSNSISIFLEVGTNGALGIALDL
jgi:hypothetical protein